MKGYVEDPALAWSGWRLTLPGGPAGGQYHGYIGPDSAGWAAGKDELSAPAGMNGLSAAAEDSSSGPWQDEWGGTIFGESEGHSDYVFRSPGEVRPRPNASGGTNVVRSLQTARSAGYAVAPGNYKGLGVVQVDGWFGVPLPPSPRCGGRVTLPGGQVTYMDCARPAPFIIQREGPGATATVTQPPPPSQPAPAPTVADPTCSQPGYYRDAAGNCTNDWHNPYSLYLPAPQSPRPAPTVAASPDDYMPSNGQVVPGITPSSSGVADWMSQSTIWPGVRNQWVVGGAVLAALVLLRGGRR
jgi:hypothetical protein